MKLILALITSLALISGAYAGDETPGKGEVKEVCHDKVGKDGKPVKKADGTVVQECKKIKVRKKLEGTEIPPAKK